MWLLKKKKKVGSTNVHPGGYEPIHRQNLSIDNLRGSRSEMREGIIGKENQGKRKYLRSRSRNVGREH